MPSVPKALLQEVPKQPVSADFKREESKVVTTESCCFSEFLCGKEGSERPGQGTCPERHRKRQRKCELDSPIHLMSTLPVSPMKAIALAR